MAEFRSHSSLHVAFMILAVVTAVITAGAIVRISHDRIRAMPIDTAVAAPEAPPLAVIATLRSGDVLVQREWDRLDFTIESAATLDESLPPGPWEGEFIATFRPGKVRNAQIGAEIKGGSLIIMREKEVLLSDYAPAHQEKTLLTRLAISLPRKREQIKFIFRSDGTGPTRVTAVWQPEGSAAPQPLPIERNNFNPVR